MPVSKHKEPLLKVSQDLGFDSNYLSVMKCSQKKRWAFLTSFDDYDIKLAWQMMEDYTQEIKDKVSDKFYTFKNSHAFAMWLVDNGIHKAKEQCSVEKLVFGGNNTIQGIRTLERIVKLIDEGR